MYIREGEKFFRGGGGCIVSGANTANPGGRGPESFP